MLLLNSFALQPLSENVYIRNVFIQKTKKFLCFINVSNTAPIVNRIVRYLL